MTFIVADRVQETTNSPGTGTATLLGAVSGYQSFSTGIGANNTTYYTIADQTGSNWEVGLGALNSTGTVLTRTTVYSSSNGGSTVNFATGTQYVWCDYPSSKAVIQGNPVNFSSIGATTAGTGAFTTLSASSTVSGAGFSNYFAAPPTIGNTTPNTGAFTNLSYTGTLTGGTGIVNLGSGQFYIDSSGNVGIGTSSPTNKLSVVGADASVISRIAGASYGLTFNSDASNGFRIEATDPTGVSSYQPLITNGSTQLFRTGNTERMRIDSSGNLLVGCTAVPNVGATPDQFGFSVSSSEIVISKNTSGTIPALYVKTIAGVSKTVIAFYNGVNNPGNITTTPTTTTYAGVSDYRLKENVLPMVGALEKVALLKPVTYKWKLDGSDGQGFIAHELQKVVPDCVVGEKDAVDAEGNPQYQGIDTSFLVATLTSAIQELKAIIDTQQTRLTVLEAK